MTREKPTVKEFVCKLRRRAEGLARYYGIKSGVEEFDGTQHAGKVFWWNQIDTANTCTLGILMEPLDSGVERTVTFEFSKVSGSSGQVGVRHEITDLTNERGQGADFEGVKFRDYEAAYKELESAFRQGLKVEKDVDRYVPRRAKNSAARPADRSL